MTDTGLKSDDAVDELIATHAKIADDLARLSEAQEVPYGFKEVYDPFLAEDIDFGSVLWVRRLIQVQAWLNLEEEISYSLFEESPVTAAKRIIAASEEGDLADGVFVDDGRVCLSQSAADELSSRLDTAIRLQEEFETDRESEVSRRSATDRWLEAWEAEPDSVEFPEPIAATVTTWHIAVLARQAKKGKLNLRPSYQRSDVWSLKDSQILIESILRGIPLPSIILLNPAGKESTVYEVVDGKQRLTAILRFIGQHPEAVRLANKAQDQSQQNGDSIDFPTLLRDDYPKFRKLWKIHMGEELKPGIEAKYCFPFKLRGKKSALSTPELSVLQGQYYCRIKESKILVAGGTAEVEEVFEDQTTSYKIPLIEYTDATPEQIHEVFNLYNDQGKKLTAEEIRNARFHKVDLCRVLLVAAGDCPFSEEVLDFAGEKAGVFKAISGMLKDYRFGTTRYKRTKILSWLVTFALHPSVDPEGNFVCRSTAAQINDFFEAISKAKSHRLVEAESLLRLVDDLSRCIESHLAFAYWPPKFRDNSDGSKWQELQLVASLVGTFLITMVEEDPIELLELHQEAIVRFCGEKLRPEKSQNKEQWAFVSDVALGMAAIVSLDLDEVGRVMESRYGANSIPTLHAASSILPE